MNKYLASLLLCVSINSMALASGSNVTYSVGGSNYEGFYVSPSANAPLVILVHDWDGLNEYEIKRAHMLAEMGYAVFAVDLFGAGIKPTEMDHMKALTGALYKDRGKMRALMQCAVDAEIGRAHV